MAEENQTSDSGAANYSRTAAADNMDQRIQEEIGEVGDANFDGVVDAQDRQITEEEVERKQREAAIPDTITDVLMNPTPGNLFNFLISSAGDLATGLVQGGVEMVRGEHRAPDPTPTALPNQMAATNQKNTNGLG